MRGLEDYMAGMLNEEAVVSRSCINSQLCENNAIEPSRTGPVPPFYHVAIIVARWRTKGDRTLLSIWHHHFL